MHVVRRSPALSRLAIAEVVSPLGDAMATIAVILHLQAAGGTGTTVAAVMFAEAIPPVLSPIAGAVADRARDPRRLIAAGALLQAAVIGTTALALPRGVPLGLLAVLLFLRAVIDTATAPALQSIVPAVIDDADLPSANSVVAAARETGSILGPPAAGLVFAAAGASWALAIDAVTFLVVIPLVLSLPASRGPAGDEPIAAVGRWRDDVRDGLQTLWRTPVLRAVAIGFWATVFFAAPDDLVLPFLGRDEFASSPLEIGLVIAAASVGLVLAAPFVAAIARRLGSPAAAITAGGITVGIGNLLTAFAPGAGAAFVTQTVRGGGTALFDAAGVRTLVQRTTPAPLLGRVFANLYGGVGVCAALGYVIGGPLLDATSPRAMFVVIGLGGLAGTATCSVLLRRARPRT